MTEHTDAPKDYATGLAEQRTDMATMRTRLALERTLDAWIRTALSMISFGFTIFKFLHEFQQAQHVAVERPHAARHIGMVLVSLGTLSLLAAVSQHIAGYRQLGLHPMARPLSLGTVVAVFLILLGVLVFLSIAADMGPF